MGRLTYMRNDNLYYPGRKETDIAGKLGKYGQTARKYLLENRFELFEEWLLNGCLDDYLINLDVRYQTWKAKMVQSLRQNEPYSENGQYLTFAQHIYSIESKAEEFVNALLEEELKSL